MRTETEILDEIADAKKELAEQENGLANLDEVTKLIVSGTIISQKDYLNELEQELKEVRNAKQEPKEDKKPEPKPKAEKVEKPEKPEPKPKEEKPEKAEKPERDSPKSYKNPFMGIKPEVLDFLEKNFDFTKFSLPAPNIAEIFKTYVSQLYKFWEKKQVPKGAFVENEDEVYEWIYDYFESKNQKIIDKAKKEGGIAKKVDHIKDVDLLQQATEALKNLKEKYAKKRQASLAAKKTSNKKSISEQITTSMVNFWASVVRFGGAEKKDEAEKLLSKIQDQLSDVAKVTGQTLDSLKSNFEDKINEKSKDGVAFKDRLFVKKAKTKTKKTTKNGK